MVRERLEVGALWRIMCGAMAAIGVAAVSSLNGAFSSDANQASRALSCSEASRRAHDPSTLLPIPTPLKKSKVIPLIISSYASWNRSSVKNIRMTLLEDKKNVILYFFCAIN